MKKKLMLLIVGIFISVGVLSAQVRSVSGMVVSQKDGAPVIGASVELEGTSISTITDLDGKFLIKDVPSSVEKLIIRFVGMKTVKMEIGSDMIVKMKTESKFSYGKNSVFVGYNQWGMDGDWFSKIDGFSVGYAHKFELSKRTNFFLETGAMLAFSSSDEFEEMRYCRVNVPVSLGYMFNIGQSGFSVSPKAGLVLIANLRGLTNGEYHWENDGSLSKVVNDCVYGGLIGFEMSYKHFALNAFCMVHEANYRVTEGYVFYSPVEMNIGLSYSF